MPNTIRNTNIRDSICLHRPDDHVLGSLTWTHSVLLILDHQPRQLLHARHMKWDPLEAEPPPNTE